MPYTVCNVNSNGVFQVLKKSPFFILLPVICTYQFSQRYIAIRYYLM